jgi:hypothetical protein
MHSLISPSDKSNLEFKTNEPKQVEPLNLNELKEAMTHLNKDIKFAQVDRYYADPLQMNQKIALFSFIPSKEAKPDKDGIYGMAKIRGVYATEEEANERAEFLIKNVDSYHEIYHSFVGRPFPITTSDKFSIEIKNIDIRKKTTDIICEDILDKKRKEKQEMKEIADKEKKLLEESKRAINNEPQDVFEEYITENVKRAQLIWTFQETKKKLDQMKDTFKSATLKIRELNELHPDFQDKYKDKYMEARRESGIPDDNDSFIKFLGLDLNILDLESV